MTEYEKIRPVLYVGDPQDHLETIELQPIVRTVIKGTRERAWVRALKDSDEQRAFDAAHQGLRSVRIDGSPVRIAEREERQGDWIVYWIEPA